VNWHHLQAFFWLRWRLRINQLRRSGMANVVILTLLLVGAFLLAGALFITFLLVGLFAFSNASPAILLYVWDGLVVAFLFLWMIGLLQDLQRSEVLSLDKFLHLPVSLTGVFLINYLSSLLSFNLLLFIPAFVGFCLGLVFAKGPAMLLVFPLLAAFLLTVSALTYQFQGWLASLMVNPRRRRTVIVFVTLGFILLCQLPNLFNMVRPWGRHEKEELDAQLNQEMTKSQSGPDQREALSVQEKHAELARERNDELWRKAFQTATIINLALPPGWLPYGAMESAEGNFLAPLLGTLGLGVIGGASLWRSYQTTLRLYTGHYSSKKRKSVVKELPVQTEKPAGCFLEKQLPWLSEHTAAVALGSFRSLLRAPEAKMMLLTPAIMVLVFGSIFLSQRIAIPEAFRPIVALGAMAMILLFTIQLVGNQFAFDRNGFRVFVLCASPRRDILLGKNLAIAPFTFGFGALVVILVQIISPMPVLYFLATFPLFVSMYLVFCLLANWLSILAPLHIAPGSFKTTNFKGIPLLLHLAFVFVFPMAMAPTMLPVGIGLALGSLGWGVGGLICLVLSLVECVAIGFCYRFLVALQGDLLQGRELKILEVVTTKDE